MIDIKTCYPTLPSMLRKFDRYARKDYFTGETKAEFEQWRNQMQTLLWNLLGLDKMERCDLNPILDAVTELPEGIRREHLRIQVEPDVWMTMYVLIPKNAKKDTRPFLCPPGHNGAGKYTVAGMLTWDLMRAIDYLQERGEWNTDVVSCLGFSGGGMQTMWLSALDNRVKLSVISGYLYGYRDSLLTLNQNCSCNYVPHLWEHLDMGDIVSLIAPRPLLIQSCKEDRLNGPRGMINVIEQVEVVQTAYELMGVPEQVIHEICDGGHQWHGEHLENHLHQLLGHSIL